MFSKRVASLVGSGLLLLQLLHGASAQVKTNLIQLIPFKVTISVDGSAADVDSTLVDQAVTDWMTTSFKDKSEADKLPDEGITFGLIDLTRSDSTKATQSGSTYIATYTGTSLWERSGENYNTRIDQEKIDLIQRFTFIESQPLETLLVDALGSTVKDANAFITPDVASDQGDDTGGSTNNADLNNTSSNSAGSDNAGSSGNNNLEIIIIVAIVVACLAFLLLAFAVCWAWKSDRNRRGEESVSSSYANNTNNQKPHLQPQHAPKRQKMGNSPDGTGSESDYDPESPNAAKAAAAAAAAAGNGDAADHYPDSIISDDISTSLTAYYRSGMSSYNMPRSNRYGGNAASAANDMNDAASMSSMDSYGYSLDGYAPSLSGGPTQMGYPVEPPTPAGEDDDMVDNHPKGRR